MNLFERIFWGYLSHELKILEHVNVKDLAERNIKLGYTPDVLTDAGKSPVSFLPFQSTVDNLIFLKVADLSVMLALMAGRLACEAVTFVNEGNVRSPFTHFQR